MEKTLWEQHFLFWLFKQNSYYFFHPDFPIWFWIFIHPKLLERKIYLSSYSIPIVWWRVCKENRKEKGHKSQITGLLDWEITFQRLNIYSCGYLNLSWLLYTLSSRS